MYFRGVFIALGTLLFSSTFAFGFSEAIQYKKIDLAASYITQSQSGETYTLIPYWAPQISLKDNINIGLRVGGTVVNDSDKKRVFAFESDVHADYQVQCWNQELGLQPLIGIKSWEKMGTAVSGGFNIYVKPAALNQRVFAGAQVWNKSGRDYIQYSLGVGYEF